MTEKKPETNLKEDAGAPMKSVCVYCGSRPGRDPSRLALARALGGEIASAGLRLVYGAGELGLMGAVAVAAREAGADVLGVIPDGLFGRERSERAGPGVIVTESLHQRKSLMLANADAAIVLPGGVGTLDEFIEAATWRHLGLHRKPIVLLDPDDYWRPLMTMFARMDDEEFLWADFAPLQAPGGVENGSVFEIARNPADAIERIRRVWAADAAAAKESH